MCFLLNDKTSTIKMADYVSAFAFTSVGVSAPLLSAGQKVCEKCGGRVIILIPSQSGMCFLFCGLCQTESGDVWSDEAAGAAGRVKDSVIRH